MNLWLTWELWTSDRTPRLTGIFMSQTLCKVDLDAQIEHRSSAAGGVQVTTLPKRDGLYGAKITFLEEGTKPELKTVEIFAERVQPDQFNAGSYTHQIRG